MKVVFVTNIPAHYRVALIRRAFKILKDKNIELITLFSRLSYRRRSHWKINKEDFDFEYQVLGNKNSIALKNKLFELGFNAVSAVKKIKPDLIISAGFSLQSYLLSNFCKRNNISFLVYSGETVYTALNYKRNLIRKILRKKINSNTNYYIVYGLKAGDYIEKTFLVNDKRIYKVINTIDTEGFIKKINKSAVLEKSKYIILFVGELRKIKGLDLFIKSVSLIEKDLLNQTEIWIIGDGVIKNDLKKMILSFSLSNIKLLGKINHEEIAYYYKNCDLFVLPSIYEHFGLVLVEAAIAGKPLIASKYCGGAYDLIEEGKNGYIVDPYDTKIFAEKIKSLIISQEKNRKFGEHSKYIISSRVNIDIAVKSFCKAIMECIN